MMELDWTTFLLEIINFLVLIWILQRFLYRPVLSLLDARQQRIQAETEQAARLRQEAESLRQQYETHLADWQQHQEASRHALAAELAQLRQNALHNLQKSLDDEETQWRARNQSLLQSQQTALTRQATETAYAQVATLLQRLASPHLTEAIVEIFVQDLGALSESERMTLHQAATGSLAASAIEVISAHPLSEALCANVRLALAQSAGQELPLSFRVDASLTAGLRVVVGACQMHANLADELAFFQHPTQHG